MRQDDRTVPDLQVPSFDIAKNTQIHVEMSTNAQLMPKKLLNMSIDPMLKV
jgi:hypothetical protein